MSIKAYEAYRLHRGVDLFDAVAQTVRESRQSITNALYDLYMEVFTGFRDNEPYYIKLFGLEDKTKVTPFELSHILRTKYHQQLSSRERNIFNFDVSICIWGWRSRYYMIPSRDSVCIAYDHDPLKCIANIPHWEDFSYWNNSDRPEEITAAQWGYRKRVWHELLRDENWYTREVVCHILKPDLWHVVDPAWDEHIIWPDWCYEQWGITPKQSQENKARLRGERIVTT